MEVRETSHSSSIDCFPYTTHLIYKKAATIPSYQLGISARSIYVILMKWKSAKREINTLSRKIAISLQMESNSLLPKIRPNIKAKSVIYSNEIKEPSEEKEQEKSYSVMISSMESKYPDLLKVR